MRKVWAEYLTIIITGSFIPLEIYEMVEHRSMVKGMVIVLNVAIVIYLVLRVATRQALAVPVERSMIIGVVADTHSPAASGALEHLRALAPEAILHAGDIGDLARAR